MSHPSYEAIVESAWDPDRSLSHSLGRVKDQSLIFNKNIFGNIFERKHKLEKHLHGLQRELERVDSAVLLRTLLQVQNELEETLKQEEMLWYQKSREQAIKCGDRNTRFFHTQTVIRRKRNKIYALNLPSGVRCDDEDVLKQEALRFFRGLFSPPRPNRGSLFISSTVEGLPPTAISALGAPVQKEEVWNALSHVGSLKAPGPDGFQPVFFKKYWNIVGDDLWKTVRDAFLYGTFDPALAQTLIVLIPKVDVPSSFKEFCPISLCNVAYKLITKVVVNRLRPFLQDLIGPLQNSFIPGRGTVDNAIVLQEIIHHMKRGKNKNKNIIFKLDLEKAYDSVSWEFLRDTLLFFGFPQTTIELIMFCVSSSSLTLLWNGTRLEPFSSSRGLRQGDPLSPYLFVLCMERLGIRIQDAVDSGRWFPVSIANSGPSISHLFFADDVLLFAKARVSQMHMIHELLGDFCAASGLRVNVAKSRAFAGGGVNRPLRARILSITSIPFTTHFEKYLGFPILQGRPKACDFEYVVDRVSRKLASWKGKLLNKAGKITLVKAVLNAIPVYPMQLSWFPQSVCDRLDGLARNFIWSRGETRGMHMVSWRKISRPKRFGGLGVRQARLTNTAMLGNLVWDLVNNSNKLWVRFFRGAYGPHGNFLDVPSKRGSPLWNAILRTRTLIQDGFRWQVGEGGLSFWYDDWSGLGPLCLRVDYVHVSDTALRVSDVFVDGFCDLRGLYTMRSPQLDQDLLSMCFHNVPGQPDLRVWSSSTDGEFSVSSCYTWLLEKFSPSLPAVPWSWIWKVPITEKSRIFAWQGLHNSLPMAAVLASRGGPLSDCCRPWNRGPETQLHCLRDCEDALRVWHNLSLSLAPTFFSAESFAEWLLAVPRSSVASLITHAWFIWCRRCARSEEHTSELQSH